MEKYNHKIVEPKWQKFWDENNTFTTPNGEALKEKEYILDMFPYPSGNGLHVGHPEGYTATDIVSRRLRMQGKTVLHPMGWDAFGLPAENFAIKEGIHPRESTWANIDNFRRQIKSLGFSYDWSREINTADPSYYQWTQWLFLKLYNEGLAYRKKAPVNWCESCQTVLAREQVIDGKCDRCKHEVIQKDLVQWFFKVTNYADELLEQLDGIDWPEPIKLMQKNWIGRSEGAHITFTISADLEQETEYELNVFTTRPDTLFGATYMVIAPEHELLTQFESNISNIDEVKEYVTRSKKKSELERTDLAKDKTGIELKGIAAINPATKESISVWVADYVLINYGTGAIMAVPAHDERDYEFAQKYNLDIREVVAGGDVSHEAYVGEGALINSDFLDGLTVEDAKEKINSWLEEHSSGKRATTYKLRDWLVSRQRYWGAPIPIIYCDACKDKTEQHAKEIHFYHQETFNRLAQGIKTIETRALNPEEKDRYFGDIVKGDIIKATNKKTQERIYLRVDDTKTFETFETFFEDKVYLAGTYAPAEIPQSIDELKADYHYSNDYVERIEKHGLIAWAVTPITPGMYPEKEENLPVTLPTDVDFKPTGQSPLVDSTTFHDVSCPQCGASGDGVKRESDTMDTFVDSSWYFLRYTDPTNEKEFADEGMMHQFCPVDLYVGGAEHAVLHLMYSRFLTKALRDMEYLAFDEPFIKLRNQGMILAEDGRKMSKSLGNVINPDEVIESVGADSMRLYEMFMGPLEDAKPWSTDGLVGMRRFLERFWSLQEKVSDTKDTDEIKRLLHKTIKKVSEDIDAFKFNTGISQMMILLNTLLKEENISQDTYQLFILLLSPYAPHICEELWQKQGNPQSLAYEPWPSYDESLVKDDVIELVVQVNGKVRAKISVPADISEEEAQLQALKHEKVASLVSDEPKKVIYIPGRIVNIVA